jgi:hypothetical protein
MRTVTRSHNAPSVDKMIRDFYTIAQPVDDFSPKVQGEYPPALGLRVVDEGLVGVDWEVDDEVVLVDVGPRIWTADLELEPGAHEVTAVVRDLTQWVRAADRSVLEMRVTWPLQVPAELVPTTALQWSAGRAEGVPLNLRGRSGARTGRSGRPHGLGPDRVRAMAANAELLRVRDAVVAGRVAQARERLQRHATAFGTAWARDREVLAGAIGCLQGRRSAVAARGRFAKVLRRACDG